MARGMTKPAAKLRNTIGTIAAVILLIAGTALLVKFVSIDEPVPPIETAISTTATINGQRIKPAATSGKFNTLTPASYYLSYSFVSSDNQAQFKEAEVGQAYFNSHLPGAKVTVWYLPDRPRLSVLDDPAKLAEAGSHYGVLLGGLLVVLGIWAGLHFGNRLFMERRGYSLL